MLKVKKLNPEAQVPQYQSEGAAGLDLHATEHVIIPPGQRATFGTGLAMAIPKGYVGLICDRGGMARKGLHTLAGVVDSDYRGDVCVMLLNVGTSVYLVSKGDRIAQLLVIPCPQMDVVEVDELDETERGEGRFGSTGS